LKIPFPHFPAEKGGFNYVHIAPTEKIFVLGELVADD